MRNEDLNDIDFFEAGEYYHIYNRAIGCEQLFRIPMNYDYFLNKLHEYMDEAWELHCWCLMPNHFHLLVRIKSDPEGFSDPEALNKKVYTSFGNFTNGYAKAINKAFNRKGGLFIKKFKRKRIGDEYYLRDCIRYIHLNPVHHGFRSSPGQWTYSSFNQVLENPGDIRFKEVIAAFTDFDGFLTAHGQ